MRRCSTKTDEAEPQAWDEALHRPDDDPLFEPQSPPSSHGRRIVAGLFLAAAAVAAYVVFTRRAPEPPVPTSTPTQATTAAQPLGGEAASIVVPPLDESDGVVADLVRKLSSHPRVAAWLTTKGLIRNFAAVVLRINDGKTPANLLQPLRPTAAFRVTEREGGIYIDSPSYERYTALAQAVASIDAKGSASLYATLKPRIEEAYRELGYPDASFDAALERAIGSLLETPVRSRPTRLRLQGIGYAFADPHDEALTGAQKQLLRMGPENGLIIQAKLREIALALGIPPQRLPK